MIAALFRRIKERREAALARWAAEEKAMDPVNPRCVCGHRKNSHNRGGTGYCIWGIGTTMATCGCTVFIDARGPTVGP